MATRLPTKICWAKLSPRPSRLKETKQMYFLVVNGLPREEGQVLSWAGVHQKIGKPNHSKPEVEVEVLETQEELI